MANSPTSALLWAYLKVSPLIRLFARRHLERRIVKGKEHPQRYREKMGITGALRPDGPLIWMHAVGVGELLALPALVREMLALDPALNFLLTSSARTSAQAVEHNLPPRSIHQFLPLDSPTYIRRFLDHWQPQLSIWAERDIWPAFLTELQHRNIPMALVNGRMSATSARSKQKACGMFAALYDKFNFIEVQDDESAKGFTSLGVPIEKIRVTGTLKAGADPLADLPEKHERMETALAGRPRWLAASTHPEDEIEVFKAQKLLLAANPETFLIIAPRLPDRAKRILKHAQDQGFEAVIINEDTTELPQIAIVDRIGEMGLWYRVADQCLIGGSFSDVQGHNPYEPARLDCAITHGPNVANFAEDYAAFHAANAARQVNNAGELASALIDPGLLELRQTAAKVADQGKQAVARTAQRLVALL